MLALRDAGHGVVVIASYSNLPPYSKEANLTGTRSEVCEFTRAAYGLIRNSLKRDFYDWR
jgi:hypothetical protein